MNSWVVAVPSWKRAGRVSTDRFVRGAKIVVPESQETEYREKQPLRNGAEIVVCPDDADGNIARKRNWILDRWPGRLVMMDDDYKFLGMQEGGRWPRLSLDQVEGLLEDGFQMAEDLGTPMWGINFTPDPLMYKETTPFSFLVPILGPFQGFVDMDLRNDESFTSKEDYDLWLRVVHKYRKTLRFNKYHYLTDHLKQVGGIVTQRTMAEEKRQFEALWQRYGRRVVQWKGKTINPRIHLPIPGV